jgi:hypothetical protein
MQAVFRSRFQYLERCEKGKKESDKDIYRPELGRLGPTFRRPLTSLARLMIGKDALFSHAANSKTMDTTL